MDTAAAPPLDKALTVEVMRPDALSAADRAAWAAMRPADPRLDPPYLDYRFTLAAADVPGAALAVFRRDGAAVGFFPFQRRGRLIQPLGAPMSDYHAVVAAPGETFDPATVARLLGASLRVGGWLNAGPAPAGFIARQRMAADVSMGREALCRDLDTRDHKFFKNMRRLGRGFERDLGAPVFLWDDRDPAVLDWIVARKREQYRRTRRHDVFACGWTLDLLRRLSAMWPEGFGVRVSSLRTQAGEIVAAEASLDDGRTLHMWFPAYEAKFARYGPGLALTRMEMEAAADEGYALVDFGGGEEGYKSALAESVGSIFEGVANGGAAGRMLARGPAPVRSFGRSLGRRLDIINACETRPVGWLAGAAGAAVAAARKTVGAAG